MKKLGVCALGLCRFSLPLHAHLQGSRSCIKKGCLPFLPLCTPLIMTGKVKEKKRTRQPCPISRLSSGSDFFPERQPACPRSLGTDGEEPKGTRQSPHLRCRHKCRKKSALCCATFRFHFCVPSPQPPIQPSTSSALPLASVVFSCQKFLSGNFPPYPPFLSVCHPGLDFILLLHTVSQADSGFSIHLKHSAI